MYGISRVVTLLILTNLFHQHDGAVSVEGPTNHNGKDVIINSPVGHKIIKNRTVTGGTIDDARPRLEVIDRPSFRNLEEVDHSGDGYQSSHEDQSEHNKPYGSVLLATLLVNLITIIGLTLFIPLAVQKRGHCFTPAFWKSSYQKTDGKEDDGNGKLSHFMNILIPSFACGALLATTVFLIVPEGQAFIQKAVIESHDDEEEEHEEHDEEGGEILSGGAIARFGTSLLAGYMLPLLFGAFFPQPSEHDYDDKCDDVINEFGATDPEDGSTLPKSSGTITLNLRLIASIIIGDAAHNFCDGVFIGVAFMSCSNATALTIVGITIYHEVAQEIADFCLLTKHGRLSTVQALALNFLAGLSVMVGGLLILGANISDMTIGVILSFSGGVYLYIAASECLPRVESVVNSTKDRLHSILFFLLGAIPIGLTLLRHEHCSA